MPFSQPEISEHLDLLDRLVGSEGVELKQRPLHVALRLVRDFIVEVDDGGERTAPGKTDEILTSRWFRAIFQQTREWYRERYGKRMDERNDHNIRGVVEIFETLFSIAVPTTIVSPGTKPGETIWIGFPDKIRTDEVPGTWIVNGPDLQLAPEKDRKRAEKLAREIAGQLRFIRCGLMGVGSADEPVDSLVEGVVPHLEAAADLLAQDDPVARKKALWELQMAIELSLKAITQQRSGGFTETHDLFILYDRVPDGLTFTRNTLKKLPDWQMMVQLRYGGGPTVYPAYAFNAYRAALKAVAGAVEGLTRIRIGEARFEIQKPPWMQEL